MGFKALGTNGLRRGGAGAPRRNSRTAIIYVAPPPTPAEGGARTPRRPPKNPFEDYAIIYVEENLAQELQHEIDKFKDAPKPAIILIPGREGPLGLGQTALKAAVERAVGSDIL